MLGEALFLFVFAWFAAIVAFLLRPPPAAVSGDLVYSISWIYLYRRFRILCFWLHFVAILQAVQNGVRLGHHLVFCLSVVGGSAMKNVSAYGRVGVIPVSGVPESLSLSSSISLGIN